MGEPYLLLGKKLRSVPFRHSRCDLSVGDTDFPLRCERTSCMGSSGEKEDEELIGSMEKLKCDLGTGGSGSWN